MSDWLIFSNSKNLHMLTTMTGCSSQRVDGRFEVSVATTKSGGLTISVQTSHNIHCD